MSVSQSVAAQAVAFLEREILTAEGPHHVGGAYYASAYDAEHQSAREGQSNHDPVRHDAFHRQCLVLMGAHRMIRQARLGIVTVTLVRQQS